MFGFNIRAFGSWTTPAPCRFASAAEAPLPRRCSHTRAVTQGWDLADCGSVTAAPAKCAADSANPSIALQKRRAIPPPPPRRSPHRKVKGTVWAAPCRRKGEGLGGLPLLSCCAGRAAGGVLVQAGSCPRLFLLRPPQPRGGWELCLVQGPSRAPLPTLADQGYVGWALCCESSPIPRDETQRFPRRCQRSPVS